MAPAGPRPDTRRPDVARGAPGAQTPITRVRSERAARERETTMDSSQQRHPTHLFTVRLWVEDLGEGRAEWRGQVQHVLSGDVRYFRDWPTLITLLRAMLLKSEINLDLQGDNAQ